MTSEHNAPAALAAPPAVWTTSAGIAGHLGVSLEAVRLWVKTAGMPASRVNGTGAFRFEVGAVDQWMRSQQAA